MEKKGEILNQLAIISDLLEKINLESEKTVVNFNLNKTEFDKFFKLISQKMKIDVNQINQTFILSIGDVSFVFNTNNA